MGKEEYLAGGGLGGLTAYILLPTPKYRPLLSEILE